VLLEVLGVPSGLPSRDSICTGDVFMQKIVAGLLLLGILRISAQPALVVNGLDQADLEGALNKGGTIIFGMDGTISLTNTLVVSTNTTLDGTGRKITLDGGNAVRLLSVTNAVTLRLVNLSLVNGHSEGTKGQTNQSGGPALGGAIYASGAVVELSGCIFANNHSIGGAGGTVSDAPGGGPAYGGAIYCADGQLLATSCFFSGNSATGGMSLLPHIGESSQGGDAVGGAIYSTNTSMRLADVIFTNNQVQAGDIIVPSIGAGASFGGGLADAAGSTTISTCSFLGNQALGATRVSSAYQGSANGGAIAHQSGMMVIQYAVFEGNSASGGGGVPGSTDLGKPITPPIYAVGNGGAIYNQAGTLSVGDAAMISNQAVGANLSLIAGFGQVGRGGTASGGAIYNAAQLSLTNCTVAGNAAKGGSGVSELAGSGGSAFGGAIFDDDFLATARLVNVTIAQNSVQAGGTPPLLPGYTQSPFPYPPPVALGSSISVSIETLALVNSILACGTGQTNVSGTIEDAGHNLSSDFSANFTSPSSRSGIDPEIGPVSDNGGPTPTIALRPRSPALDAGDDSACPPTDQRGVTRPQGVACDIGAFELAPKLVLERGTNGIVSIDYKFEAGKTSYISASTNLINWVLLGSQVSDANGNIHFQDGTSALFSERFYGVVQHP
jgi:hypothetical protein